MIPFAQAKHGRVGGLRPLAFPQATRLGLMALAIAVYSGRRDSRGRPEQ